MLQFIKRDLEISIGERDQGFIKQRQQQFLTIGCEFFSFIIFVKIKLKTVVDS